VGGVALGLDGRAAVVDAYRRMQRALGSVMEGAMVQPMSQPGVETIAGFVADPAFGPLVLFGLGGTSVELLGDSATRLAPLDELDVREMFAELRTAPLLTGYRGSAPVDLDALSWVLLRLSRLAEDLPELAEADCNPLIASTAGVAVVDARLRVNDAPAGDDVAVRHLRSEPASP
jgi:acyl-CoA synthetase (NDP forming)